MAIEEILAGLKSAGDIAQAISKTPGYKVFINKLRPAKKILLVGESGSGKTQFLNVLQEKAEVVEKSTMTVSTVVITLPNGRRLEITDTPGQQTLQDQRIKAENDICKKKYDGIINIVCYGYQASSDTKIEDVFQTGTSTVKQAYLEDNRKKEIKQVGEWITRIDSDSSVNWVLTIVNKADIWYSTYNAVMGYYNSTYRDELNKISNFKKIPVVPYCCVIAPFCDKPMTLAMGEKEKNTMHKDLLMILSELLHIQWK